MPECTGGEKPGSGCSSTGASTPSSPANTRARRWEGSANGSCTTSRSPSPEYQPLTKQFNPVQFDADKWVSIAKAAGMKYIVMTSKHHEGFAMFPLPHRSL